MVKESDLNKAAQDLIESIGGYVIKTIATNKAGVHDILACIKGRFCSFEGKLEYNKMSELQKAHQIKVIKAGGYAVELRSMADIWKVVEWIDADYKQPIPESSLKEFEL